MNDFPTQKSIAGASYVSSFASAAGGAMTLNEIALLVGIVLAFLTFVINTLYQMANGRRKARLEANQTQQAAEDERRKQEIHDLQTKLLSTQLEQARGGIHGGLSQSFRSAKGTPDG